MYKLVDWDELVQLAGQQARDMYDYDWDDDHEYRYYVVKLNTDGTFQRFVATEGGEPEDQTLGRDWSWVVPELNRALNEK